MIDNKEINEKYYEAERKKQHAKARELLRIQHDERSRIAHEAHDEWKKTNEYKNADRETKASAKRWVATSEYMGLPGMAAFGKVHPSSVGWRASSSTIQKEIKEHEADRKRRGFRR